MVTEILKLTNCIALIDIEYQQIDGKVDPKKTYSLTRSVNKIVFYQEQYDNRALRLYSEDALDLGRKIYDISFSKFAISGADYLAKYHIHF